MASENPYLTTPSPAMEDVEYDLIAAARYNNMDTARLIMEARLNLPLGFVYRAIRAAQDAEHFEVLDYIQEQSGYDEQVIDDYSTDTGSVYDDDDEDYYGEYDGGPEKECPRCFDSFPLDYYDPNDHRVLGKCCCLCRRYDEYRVKCLNAIQPEIERRHIRTLMNQVLPIELSNYLYKYY